MADEEEAVGASHREGEVLSCYTRGFPNSQQQVVGKIVTVLQTREEEPEKKPAPSEQLEREDQSLPPASNGKI